MVNEKVLKARMAALTREAQAKARAEKAADRKLATDRLRARAANDLGVIEQGRRERARVEAMHAARAAQPITVTITKGRLTVTLDVTSPDVTVRQTAEQAIKTTVNRLLRWTEAQCGAAAARALGVQGASPATAEEIACFLQDEEGFRQSVKFGTVTVSVAPEKRKRK